MFYGIFRQLRIAESILGRRQGVQVNLLSTIGGWVILHVARGLSISCLYRLLLKAPTKDCQMRRLSVAG
jgi:hypothetical protein